MNCPACATPVVADAHFCHACGVRVIPATDSHPPAGATETDRLPSWLKQETQPAAAPERNAGTQSAPPWPRPIPDGGLAQSMPAWLSPDASHRDGAVPVENAPPPPATQSHEQASPADDQPATIDVASFLSADDLPVWIRRIADPVAEATPGPIPAPAPKPEPQRQPQPQSQPPAKIGTRASRPAASSPERPAVKPTAAAARSPIERVPTIPRQAVGTESLDVSKRSNKISWHLLLFVAVLAAVATAGYAIYLVSFT
jgi:hypothetical protein